MNKSESKYFNTAVKMNKALIALLENKEFEYITVKEICKEAGVNRSTFYLHYETINDLLTETVNYILDHFLSYFPAETKHISNRFRDTSLLELNFVTDEYLTPYLRFIKENSCLFLTAVRHIRTLGFDNVYTRLFQHIFDPVLNRFGYPETERKFVMAFYLNGLTAIIVEWLKEGCKQTIEEIIEIIRECIFGRVHELKANFSEES